MAKRTFLMLAHDYQLGGNAVSVDGWFVSEKLDGQRAFWDGGISRGLPKRFVPWANTLKDERFVSEQIATGLWSRYGNVIHAPAAWLDQLPKSLALDGELYINRKTPRQLLRSIVSPQDGGQRLAWSDIKYFVFDSPPFATVFADGRMNDVNFQKAFIDIRTWLALRVNGGMKITAANTPFSAVYSMLKSELGEAGTQRSGVVAVLRQDVLSGGDEAIDDRLEAVSRLGGEGLVIRSPYACYECCRSHILLKLKKLDDAEGTVIGYTTGAATTKGSKLLGMMGALIVDIGNGKRLELSGFTEAERALEPEAAMEWAIRNPSAIVPDWISASAFPRGTVVTYQYRGLSRDGIPQEARYWRRAD